MVLDWRVRLGLIVGGAVIVAVALAGAAWGALDQGLVRDALTLIGGLLAGLGVAGGKGRAAAVVLLLAALPLLPACGGSQAVDVERCTVAVMRCAAEVVAECIPRDGDGDGDRCDLSTGESARKYMVQDDQQNDDSVCQPSNIIHDEVISGDGDGDGDGADCPIPQE